MRKFGRRKIILTVLLFVSLGLFSSDKISTLKAATSNVDKTLEQLKILIEVFDYIQQHFRQFPEVPL